MPVRIPIGWLSYRKTLRFEREPNVRIGRRVRIIGDHVRLCEGVRIDAYCHIQGKTVELGRNVHLQHHVEIGGMQTDNSTCRIGEGSQVFTDTILNDTHPIVIGKNVGIGGRSMIWTHGGWGIHPVEFGPITIEDDVWLAWHVIVCPNVTIGRGSIIGAGAVVTRDVPPYSVAAGVPAKVVGKSQEKAEE